MNSPTTGGTARGKRRHLTPVADTGTEPATDDQVAGPAVPDDSPTSPSRHGGASRAALLGRGGISSTDATTHAAAGDDLAEQMATQVAQTRAWLPPVDPVVFDCYLGQLTVAIEPYSEADPIAVMASLLAAAGAHLGPGPHLPIGMERHPLVVWPMLIGHTGSGRKGTAWGAAKHLLSAAVPEFVAANIHSGLSSGEGLAAVFATDQEGDAPAAGHGRKAGGRRARLLPEDDIRLLAYEPEWASVMARMKREGNTLSATLRAAWEGGNLSTLNVDARVARQGHVGILAHITPGEFKARVTAADMAGGTYNRFLPVAVAQSKFLHLPTPPDPGLIERLADELADRLGRAREFGALALSGPARDTWASLYLQFATHVDEHGGHGGGQLAEFTSRAAAQCLRIAGLYAAIDGTALVQPTHLTTAAALVRYSIASATAVLRPGRELADLAAFIATAGEQGRTRTEITTEHFKGKPPATMAALLEQLVQTGQVTTAERPRADGKSGRKATVYTAANLAKFRT